jgi:tetratricopeptide (TPR) repeat protein
MRDAPVLAALLCALLSVSTPAHAATSSAAKGSATDLATDGFDAAEIAARAAASAVAGDSAAQNSDIAAGAYDSVVRDLLLRIDATEKEHGHVARELEAPLFELGKLYVSAEQCQNAIPILRQAALLSQRLDGVMNPRQLRVYEPLSECYVALDMVRDLARVQEQVLLVRENIYGKDDIRMLPALARAGEWYERAGDYQSARDLYSRAMRIARKAGGDQDIRLVLPLRAMARTYRLEMQYEQEGLRGKALDAQGQRTLERAARIVRTKASEAPRQATDAPRSDLVPTSNTDGGSGPGGARGTNGNSVEVDAHLRVDTLLELADWYQMGGAVRDAVKVYKEAWQAAVASGQSGADLLGEPQPILYRAAVGVALRRPPADREKLKHYWIDFEFTVTRFGEVTDVVATNATAPRDLQLGIAENLKRTHYRPRFIDGEAVDTPGVRIRQGVWVSN